MNDELARFVPQNDAGTRQFDERLPLLRPQAPGAERQAFCDEIVRLDLKRLLPKIDSAADATAFRAGLLQVNDFLAASHEQSQSIEGEGRHAAGDYWHAIIHRREPDASNAKYWFRRVGSHPIFIDLAARAKSLLAVAPEVSTDWCERLLPGGRWDPFAFVDLCESCPTSERDELSQFARRLQWIEMELLLEQTRRDAVGE